MKTLILIRHAKSSWDDPSLPDHDRPLNERGLRDAEAMGRRLAERGVRPDRLLSSSALRALTTARLVAKALHVKRDRIEVVDRLYAAPAERLRHIIAALDGNGPAAACVLLFGHNPEITDFAQRLAPEISHMPTCAVAEFDFDADTWAAALAGPPRQVRFDYPKKVRGED